MPNYRSIYSIPAVQYRAPSTICLPSSYICGSDLQMYEGRTAAEPGIMFSQENMGTIPWMVPAEKEGKVGDGVVMPFNVTCGLCKNCLGGFTGFCTTVAPGPRRVQHNLP